MYDTFLHQRPMGLLPLLDEESKFPQASDLSLAGMVHYNSIILELPSALTIDVHSEIP